MTAQSASQEIARDASLAERAYGRLVSDIHDGVFAPGSRIRENEMAEWLAMSRRSHER